MIHVVHLGTAKRVETAKIVHGRDLLLDGVGYLVLSEEFADAARLALGTRAVIAENIEDERVVANA